MRALSLWDFEFEIFESLFDEVLKAGVAFIEGPPKNFGPFFDVNIVSQPLPGQSGFTKSAERTKNEKMIF